MRALFLPVVSRKRSNGKEHDNCYVIRDLDGFGVQFSWFVVVKGVRDPKH